MNHEIADFTWRLADFLSDNYEFDGDIEFSTVEQINASMGTIVIDTTDGRTIRIAVVDIHPTN